MTSMTLVLARGSLRIPLRRSTRARAVFGPDCVVLSRVWTTVLKCVVIWLSLVWLCEWAVVRELID